MPTRLPLRSFTCFTPVSFATPSEMALQSLEARISRSACGPQSLTANSNTPSCAKYTPMPMADACARPPFSGASRATSLPAGSTRTSVPCLSFIALPTATAMLKPDEPVWVQVVLPVEPLTVMSDPVKVRQVLVNLTGNAAKFTENGSIVFALSLGGRSASVSVIDTGIGIREEHLGRLFTAFSQIEDAKTKRHEGTGLGLLISRNMAELLGGAIAVTSVYGKGTTFTLTLPHTPQNENEQEEK